MSLYEPLMRGYQRLIASPFWHAVASRIGVKGEYVRFYTTSADNWFQPIPDIEKIASHIFDLKQVNAEGQSVQSVYFCSSCAHEIEAATVFEATNGQASIRKLNILRITAADIRNSGVVLDPYGDCTKTNVLSVDGRHANIVGTKQAMEKLIEVIVDRQENGGDIHRRLWDNQLAKRMKMYLNDRQLNPDRIIRSNWEKKVADFDRKIASVTQQRKPAS